MEESWISREERLPTIRDADNMNCVMAWHRYQGVMITGWRNVQDNAMFTDWRRTPKGPRRAREEWPVAT